MCSVSLSFTASWTLDVEYFTQSAFKVTHRTADESPLVLPGNWGPLRPQRRARLNDDLLVSCAPRSTVAPERGALGHPDRWNVERPDFGQLGDRAIPALIREFDFPSFKQFRARQAPSGPKGPPCNKSIKKYRNSILCYLMSPSLQACRARQRLEPQPLRALQLQRSCQIDHRSHRSGDLLTRSIDALRRPTALF